MFEGDCVVVFVPSDVDFLLRFDESVRTHLYETGFRGKIVNFMRICPVVEIEVYGKRKWVLLPNFVDRIVWSQNEVSIYDERINFPPKEQPKKSAAK